MGGYHFHIYAVLQGRTLHKPHTYIAHSLVAHIQAVTLLHRHSSGDAATKYHYSVRQGRTLPTNPL
ncbi:MAG: hypothetical protein ABW157_06570 [Candidatus Thiodiazotropha sp. LLP2]